jgi:hypothetical protein
MHLVKTRRQWGLAIGEIFSQTFRSKGTKMKPLHVLSLRDSDGLISLSTVDSIIVYVDTVKSEGPHKNQYSVKYYIFQNQAK